MNLTTVMFAGESVGGLVDEAKNEEEITEEKNRTWDAAVLFVCGWFFELEKWRNRMAKSLARASLTTASHFPGCHVAHLPWNNDL